MMPLCACCRGFIATAYGPGGFREIPLCSRCFLKLKSVMVAMQAPMKPIEQAADTRQELLEQKEIAELDAMWKLDNSWVRHGG